MRVMESFAAMMFGLVATAAGAGEPSAPFDIQRPVIDSLQSHTLVVSGWIGAGSADRLHDTLSYDIRNGLSIDTIELDSAGGDPVEAERIGALIRTYGVTSPRGLATVVAAGGVCEGACALAFLGGTIRRVEDGGVYAVSPVGDDDVAGVVAARTDLSLYARAPYLAPEQIDLWHQAVAAGDIDPFSGMIYADLDVVREDTITSQADRKDNDDKRARLRAYNQLIDALERGREFELPAYARSAEKLYAASAVRLGAYVSNMIGDTALVTDVMLQPDNGAPQSRAQGYRQTVRRLLHDADVADDQLSALLSVPEAHEAAEQAHDTPMIGLNSAALMRYGVVTPSKPVPFAAASPPCSGFAPSCRP
jgi:hypothetical protein